MWSRALLVGLAVAALAPAVAHAQTTIERYADDFRHGTVRIERIVVDDAALPRRLRAAGVRRKTAVILFNFSDDISRPITPAYARQVVFSGAESANAFHRAQSYGAISFGGIADPAGDVFGWYTISATKAPCDINLWTQQAQAKVTAAGVDVDAYDHLLFVFPDAFQENCEFGGLGDVPGRRTWYHASQLDWAVSHELGHNLGLHHANAYDCRDAGGARVTLSNDCTSVEYGDEFDVMGATRRRHPNGSRKEQLGFLAPTTVSEDGVYHLSPIEGDTGVRALRIARDTSGGVTRHYYLEVRQPEARFDDYFCMDPVVRGVTLRLVDGDSSYLLDATPSTESFADAPLAVGRTYVDDLRGVSIRPLSIDESGADVAISFDGDLPSAQTPVAPYGGVGGIGVAAEYFGDRDLGGAALAAVFAPTIDFTWAEAAPQPGVPADNFSARFHGYLVPAVSGSHVFATSSDDGVRLWVDGQPLIDDWTLHGPEGNIGHVELTRGQPVEVLMEYFDGGVSAEARLAWQPPGSACEIVPQGRLFPEPVDPDDLEEEEPPLPEEAPEADGGDLVGGCAVGASGPVANWALALVLLVAWFARRSRSGN